VAWLASSINFIRSIDEVDGMDVNVSTSIASLQELIFAGEDGGVVMASVRKPLEFSEFSEIKLYSDSPAGESCDSHVSDATIACEASCASLTHPGALGNCVELRDPCMLIWVPMSHPPVSSGPGIPIPWNLFIDAQ
jgi:hypothetical protein